MRSFSSSTSRPSWKALAALVIFAVSGCRPSPDDATWGSGHGPDFCSAIREFDAEPLSFTLSRAPNASGVSMHGPAFSAFGPDREYSDVSLFVNGQPVRAHAFGAVFRGKPGLNFLFNPRRILRQHREGFSLAVHQGDREIYVADVRGPAVTALSEMVECDRARLIGRNLDYPD